MEPPAETHEDMESLADSDNTSTIGLAEEVFEDGDPAMFQARLRQHFLTHSRGSSINVSFDASTDSSESDGSSDSSGDAFREALLQHPTQLRTYIKEKLRYHFMSPIEKWKYRRVFPWKLMVQIIKIIFVTVQIIFFGMDSSQFYKEHGATETALKVYFLSDWDTVRDVFYYPPSAGPYAVYTNDDMFSHMDNVLNRYARVTEDPIGSFYFDQDNNTYVPANLCLTYYEVVSVFPFNCTVKFNNKRIERCLPVETSNDINDRVFSEDDPDDTEANEKRFHMKHFFTRNNIMLDLDRLAHARLEFNLRTMYRRHQTVFDYLVSYKIFCTVYYDNEEHDGQIEVNLNVTAAPDFTNATYSNWPYRSEIISRQFLNFFVMSLSIISFVLCVRSVLRCYELHNKTVEYFQHQMEIKLCWSDRLEFLDLWLCLIVFNDILIVSGSIFKILLDFQHISAGRFKYASVLLGSGMLLVWCGIIRYLGYMRSYNVLILTLKKSFPDLLKFMIGALTLFMGYALCGWVVLGPHHMKFKTFATSAECLFAIMNGDDIYATFALASDDFAVYPISPLVWWFARLYLYSFVILFICIVINLLVAVICEAFESIKELSDAGRPQNPSFVHEFINEKVEKASSINYLLDEQADGRMSTFEALSCCIPWFARQPPDALLDDDLLHEPSTSDGRFARFPTVDFRHCFRRSPSLETVDT